MTLLILTVLSTAACVVSLFVSFPLSTQHIVALVLLAVATVSAIMAVLRLHKDKEMARFNLESMREALEEKVQQSHKEQQVSFTHLEESLAEVHKQMDGQMRVAHGEILTLANEISVTTSNMNSLLITQSNGITKLEKSDQHMGRLLVSMGKDFEQFRNEFIPQLATIATQVNEAGQGLSILSDLTIEINKEIKGQKKKNSAILSLIEETATLLQAGQQEGESQFESQNMQHDSLIALVEENSSKLQMLQEENAASVHAQTEMDTEQRNSLARIEQGQREVRSELDLQMIKVGEEVMVVSVAIQQLVAMDGSKTEKQQMACEMLSQLIAENDAAIRDVHQLLTSIMEDFCLAFESQEGVLTALNSKVSSQQNAVVAAMKQVENSHCPQGRLEGDLTNLSLPDLLQILQLAQKTASIILSDINGSLYLERGMLVYVRQGKFAGIQAFIRIMLLVRGYFSVRFDVLPNSLPKKTRALLPELLSVIAEVDETKERISVLSDKIHKKSKLDSFLVQLPRKGVDKSVTQTFNHETPARLDELVVLMGKGVQENITLLEELYDKGKLTIIS